ncbi:hypothetical protein [Ruegeria arenilitoris]|uniref:hypothetical protein n=1 Tax=Ruegeria arenilitoris TaxID=1173585 RepID=UPI00147AB829|nr:hypothetical protein [Ruegeria arenilitoris]
MWNPNNGGAPDPGWALGVFALPYTGDARDTFMSQIRASDPAGRWYDRIAFN